MEQKPDKKEFDGLEYVCNKKLDSLKDITRPIKMGSILILADLGMIVGMSQHSISHDFFDHLNDNLLTMGYAVAGGTVGAAIGWLADKTILAVVKSMYDFYVPSDRYYNCKNAVISLINNDVGKGETREVKETMNSFTTMQKVAIYAEVIHGKLEKKNIEGMDDLVEKVPKGYKGIIKGMVNSYLRDDMAPKDVIELFKLGDSPEKGELLFRNIGHKEGLGYIAGMYVEKRKLNDAIRIFSEISDKEGLNKVIGVLSQETGNPQGA